MFNHVSVFLDENNLAFRLSHQLINVVTLTPLPCSLPKTTMYQKCLYLPPSSKSRIGYSTYGATARYELYWSCNIVKRGIIVLVCW